MTDSKKPRIVFEPGCFDNLEVEDQAELDELIAHITSMFEGKTEEEIKAMSRPVDLEELFEEDPELAQELVRQMSKMDNPDQRKLH